MMCCRVVWCGVVWCGEKWGVSAYILLLISPPLRYGLRGRQSMKVKLPSLLQRDVLNAVSSDSSLQLIMLPFDFKTLYSTLLYSTLSPLHLPSLHLLFFPILYPICL